MTTTNSIIKKWQKQGTFIRFLDGNSLNCNLNNLKYVSIDDAMDHIDSWKVDWDMDLTKKEIKTVRDPAWRRGLVFKFLVGINPKCVRLVSHQIFEETPEEKENEGFGIV